VTPSSEFLATCLTDPVSVNSDWPVSSSSYRSADGHAVPNLGSRTGTGWNDNLTGHPDYVVPVSLSRRKGWLDRISAQLQSNSRAWLHRVFPRKRYPIRHLCNFSWFLAKQVLSQTSSPNTATIRIMYAIAPAFPGSLPVTRLGCGFEDPGAAVLNLPPYPVGRLGEATHQGLPATCESSRCKRVAQIFHG
jgi:hypothetical protein